MNEIFKVEFHPADGPPRRIRFIQRGGNHLIEKVVEEKVSSSWEQVEKPEFVEYFEYSDENTDVVSL